MATITKAININIGEANTFDAIVGKQYDKSSRFLKCTFYFNGAVYSIPSGATIKINVKRPDGNSQSFDGVRNADGTATVPLSEWALQINGMVNLSVSIYDGTSKLTSTTFYLNVQEGEGEGYILVYTAGASLQAGTYYITIDGTSYHFTTGETMSAGDKIYFKSTLQTGAHEDTDGERIETFNVATGASGTQLINTELTNFIQNIYNAISARQPRLTAGDNIIITEQNVISALSGTAAPVVQTLGQNMDKVISQKGVTDKFNSVDAVDATQTARIDDIIEKLKGNVYKTQDGTSPAYIQSVPANSQAYSALGMIGGKTVGWNQLLDNGNFASASGWSCYNFTTASLSVANNKATVTSNYSGTGGDPIAISHSAESSIVGHKYLYLADFNLITGTNLIPMIEHCVISATLDLIGGKTYGQIVTSARRYSAIFLKTSGTKAVGDSWEFSNVRVIDLTAMGWGDITSTTDSRISFIKAYASANPSYNAGTLLSAKTDAVKSVGANVWDEEWELGNYDSSGAKGTDTRCIRSKNKCRCEPSTSYYLKGSANAWLCFYDAGNNFISGVTIANTATTTPSNARYFAFSMWQNYGTTYNHDIQICLNSYSEKTTYHPYKSDSFPIPSAIKSLAGYGQSAGNVYNELDIETVTYRNMKSVDLGTLTWTYWSADGEWYTDGLSGIAVEPVSASIPLNAICTTYPISSYSGKYTGAMYLLSGRLYCKNYSSTTSPTGILHYEATSGGTDYNARLYKKRVVVGNLGDMSWERNNDGIFISWNGANKTKIYNWGFPNLICPKYTTIATNSSASMASNPNDKIITFNGINPYLYVKDSTYTDAASFKAAMNGVYIYYELATEQILDVTSYFSGDVFIEVENGGTVTFHQEGNVQLEIPNRNTYLVDVFGGY